MSRSRVNAEQVSDHIDQERVMSPFDAPVADYVKMIAIASDRLIALSASGKLFERMADPRSFATGPGHRQSYVWRPMQGPFDEG